METCTLCLDFICDPLEAELRPPCLCKTIRFHSECMIRYYWLKDKCRICQHKVSLDYLASLVWVYYKHHPVPLRSYYFHRCYRWLVPTYCNIQLIRYDRKRYIEQCLLLLFFEYLCEASHPSIGDKDIILYAFQTNHVALQVSHGKVKYESISEMNSPAGIFVYRNGYLNCSIRILSQI